MTSRFSREYAALLAKKQENDRREAVESNMEFVDLGMGTARMNLGRSSATVHSAYSLVRLCKAHGLPEPLPEYRFHAERKWRFDYAWPVRLVAVEIEGGVWTNGRHTRGSGFVLDMLKYNAAALLGWRILRYQPQCLTSAILDLRLEFAK